MSEKVITLEQAQWEREGDGGDDGAAGPCPVTALGYDEDGRYHFLTPSGAKRAMAVRDLTPGGLLSLFSGRPDWMIKAHPKHDKDGAPIGDFAPRAVLADLIRQCERAGMVDKQLKMRGLGVWPGPAAKDGARPPACHVGDRVFIAGTRGDLLGDGVRGSWQQAGFRDGRIVYPAKPTTAPPDIERPATAEQAALIREGLGLWAWGHSCDADMMLGWIGAALLGGFPSWRVHGQIVAEFGAGKTTLLKFLAELLGPQAEMFNSFTEPGIRQQLQNEARAVLLDEANNEGGPDGPVALTILLIRRMSGGEGAAIVKGSPGQSANVATVVGQAMLAGVNPTPLDPQDRSRIYRYELLKRTSAKEAAAKVERLVLWAAKMSPRLRARALLNWPVFASSFTLYRAVLMDAGCDGRQADMFGVLLAGRELLLHDEAPNEEFAKAEVAKLAGRITRAQLDDEQDSDGQQCFDMIQSYVPDLWRSGEKTTLGRMIAHGLNEAADDAKSRREAPDAAPMEGLNRQALAMYGMRIEADSTGRLFLLVANRHSGLERIFQGRAGLRWQACGWVTSLRRLGDIVKPWPVPLRFAGPKQRCLAIPEGLLPERAGSEPPPVTPTLTQLAEAEEDG
jgi:hypothetical protein